MVPVTTWEVPGLLGTTYPTASSAPCLGFALESAGPATTPALILPPTSHPHPMGVLLSCPAARLGLLPTGTGVSVSPRMHRLQETWWFRDGMHFRAVGLPAWWALSKPSLAICPFQESLPRPTGSTCLWRPGCSSRLLVVATPSPRHSCVGPRNTSNSDL